MINKIINSKFTWYILIGIIVILIIILLSINNRSKNEVYVTNDYYNDSTPIVDDVVVDNEEKEEIEIIFNLKGSDEVSVNFGSEYEELGYVAMDSNNNNLDDYVSITGFVNTGKPGTYELTYTLKYKDETKELKRKVIVNDINKDDIILTLNGDEVVYLTIGEAYKEQGVKATYNNKDITNDIKVTGKVDNTKVGNYKITYTYKLGATSKTITREVIVFDLDSFFKVNNSNLTISVTTNDNFIYVRLPNNVVSSNQVITYKVGGSGTYEFHLFTKTYKEYIKKIVVSSTNKETKDSSKTTIPSTKPKDTTPPSGTCKAVLRDGKTTFTVTTNDKDINNYDYSGLYTGNKPTYEASVYAREPYVILTDTSGNTTKITCEMTMETLKVIKRKKGETTKYKAESSTLKVYINKKKGWYVTRIWAKDPNYQLKKAFTKKKYFQKPSVILANAISSGYKKKIVLGFNASPPIMRGSYYSKVAKANSIYNLKEPSALLIANGKVIINDYEQYKANTSTYYIDGSNQLKMVPGLKGKTVSERKEIFENIINSGAQNTMTFGPVLIENGKVLKVSMSGDYYAKRQALCQVDSNNYIVITTNTAKARIQDFANFVGTLGCKAAVNLDGGGSIALLYKPRGTKTIKTISGNERALSSVLYFTELS